MVEILARSVLKNDVDVIQKSYPSRCNKFRDFMAERAGTTGHSIISDLGFCRRRRRVGLKSGQEVEEHHQ